MLTTSMPATRYLQWVIRWGWSARSRQGIVSNRSRSLEGQLFLQTDTAINPGNSGGPLFNQRGEVIGVTSRGFHAAFADNLGFAIPVSYVKEFIHHREAFAYDKANPNSGFRYLDPPRRQIASQPEGLKARSSGDKKAADAIRRAFAGRRPEMNAIRSRRPRSRADSIRFVSRSRFVGHRRRRARLGAWREVIDPGSLPAVQDQLPRPVSEGCLKRSFI